MNLKLKILKNGQQTHGADSSQFESLEAFEAWKQQCIESNVWGKPERWVQDTPMTPLGDKDKAKAKDKRKVEGPMGEVEEYLFEAEYTIEVTDITAQIEAEKATKAAKQAAKDKRKADRKSLDLAKTMTVKQLQEIVKSLVEELED